ncbi:MAG TPA: MBL fold metallo-hydrolase [Cytophagales bacterium]|nr:MBL fold metallo-hydrolase [Cytophagales bacterium]HAP64779.1 MBL fold metallo-hydrolase [Cytophagales bacterium]
MARFLPTLFILALASCCFLPSVDMNQYQDEYTSQTQFAPNSLPTHDSVKVTYLGVSTLLIDDGTTQILIDGWFSRFGAIKLGFGRLATDTQRVDHQLETYGIDRVKAIFVTHTHIDHAGDVGYVAEKTGAELHGTMSTANVGLGYGLPRDQVKLFQPHQPIAFGKFKVTAIPSIHTPTIPFINHQTRVFVDANTFQKKKAVNQRKYREGGSYDFLVEHGDLSILIKPSTHFIPGALDNYKADVVFLGIALAGRQNEAFQDAHYRESITATSPSLVIPIHWDSFTGDWKPGELKALPRLIDRDFPKALDRLVGHLKTDSIDCKILQGGYSIMLFGEE